MIVACLRYTFKKYFVYFSYYINELIGGVVFPLFFNILFWGEILKGNSIGYDFKYITTYMIVSNITFYVTNIDISRVVSDDIKSYKLGKKMLYPVRYVKKILLETNLTTLFRVIIIYVPVCLGLFLFDRVNLEFFNLSCWIISMLIAIAINLLVSLLIGFCSFYMTEIWGLEAFKNLVFYAFSGTFIPFDILQNEIQKIVYMTPFPFVSYFPAKLLSDEKYNLFKGYFQVSFFWIGVLSILVFGMWKFGIKKYESCGV